MSLESSVDLAGGKIVSNAGGIASMSVPVEESLPEAGLAQSGSQQGPSENELRSATKDTASAQRCLGRQGSDSDMSDAAFQPFLIS